MASSLDVPIFPTAPTAETSFPISLHEPKVTKPAPAANPVSLGYAGDARAGMGPFFDAVAFRPAVTPEIFE